uniref:Glucuronosyltransferase n=1 Tax=Rhabditophanes sp. KR3021 TaxID=114890 RepID=A0AC35TXT5_9BILA
MTKFVNLLLLVLSIVVAIQPYKILIYNPKFGHSHVQYASLIADALVDAGHEVVVLVVDMDLDIKHKGAKKARIYQIEPNLEAVRLLTLNPLKDQMWNMTDDPITQFNMFETFFRAQELTRSSIIRDKHLTDFVLKEKFDFAYTEVFNIYMVAMFKVWNIPAFSVGAATCLQESHYGLFGVAHSASYMPVMMSNYLDKMNYGERAKNLASFIFSKLFFAYNRERFMGEREVNAIYGKDFFNGEKDLQDASFFFINSHPFLEFPSPKAPKMIEISGMGMPEPQELSIYWTGILNKRKDTILISFGSLAKSSKMPSQMQKAIVEVIKSMPNATFVWKYETPEDGVIEKVDNLVLSKWVPQNDLLNHEKLSMFITHGGMNSITELAYRAKSALVIPIFGDQIHNAALVTRANIGVVMDKADLIHPFKLKEYILKVLHNEEIKASSLQLSKMLNNRPISSKELLVKHIEFACEFKKLPMLDLESKNQSFIVYYLLDIIVPFILTLLALIYISFKVVAKLISVIFNLRSVKVKSD